MEFCVDAIGVCGSGLFGWPQAMKVLRGDKVYAAEPLPSIKPLVLPPNERRRTTSLIKIALQAASEVMEQVGEVAIRIPSVFASSSGDLDVTHCICQTLVRPDKPVSPTLFHNSVHNAPEGYWSIAIGSTAGSLSLSAYDASFSAGLLEAITIVTEETGSALLVAYDVPPPEPLLEHVNVGEPFAVALLLTKPRAGVPRFSIHVERRNGKESRLTNAALESLRKANPAARSLPLLKQLAVARVDKVVLPYIGDQRVIVSTQPC